MLPTIDSPTSIQIPSRIFVAMFRPFSILRVRFFSKSDLQTVSSCRLFLGGLPHDRDPPPPPSSAFSLSGETNRGRDSTEDGATRRLPYLEMNHTYVHIHMFSLAISLLPREMGVGAGTSAVAAREETNMHYMWVITASVERAHHTGIIANYTIIV